MTKWWHSALYDTCSLITLDLLAQRDQGIFIHFPPPRHVAVSISNDSLRIDTKGRIESFVGDAVEPPDVFTVMSIWRRTQLSPAIAEVDRMVYVTAVHHQLPVVTGDSRLALALLAQGIYAGNIALILQELVHTSAMSEHDCDQALRDLAAQREHLLPPNGPQGWAGLRTYQFP